MTQIVGCCRWAFAVLTACACSSQAARYGDMVVNATSTRTEHWAHGYNEHTFVVENRSARDAHRLTIELPSAPYGNNNGLRQLRRTADVPPGASVQLSLPQPPLPLDGPNDARIRIDGVLQDGTLAVESLATPYNGYSPEVSVLVSRSFATDALRLRVEAIPATNAPTRYHRSGNVPLFTRAEADPPQWSANWLNYTRFDAVILRGAEWNELPTPIRDALVRYVAAGGVLTLVGSESVVDPLPTFFPQTDGQALRRGLGQILRIASANPAEWSDDVVRRFLHVTTHSVNSWGSLRDRRGDRFAVVDGTRIPVRGIYLLLVAFALFIGPVMVILLARRNRRIWLFWIAPTVSLATCAIIFVHALLSEGTRPTIRTDSIVVLDQESRLALSLATTGVYCPMTPSGGLSFGSETEVTPLLDMQASGRRTIDWSARQHLDSGWVLSRVPAAFVTRSVGTRHERLECAATDDGGIRIVNGLGAPIRHVRLADAQGKMHEVAGVPAGGSAALRDMPTTGKTAATTDLAQFAATTFFSTNRRISFTNAVQVANLPIPPPGHYVAVLDGAPFADNALPVAAHRTETTIVCGRLAPASK